LAKSQLKPSVTAEINNSHKEWEITTRAFLERVIDERDRLYEARFKAVDIIVEERHQLYTERFKADEKAVDTAFAASKEAVIKSDSAQKDYNVTHNDITRKMDDQYKMMLPYAEANRRFESLEEKIDDVRRLFESKLEGQRDSTRKDIETIGVDIKGLRESRSNISGQKVGARELWGYFAVAAGIISGYLFHFIK
jgi:phosphopantetheinyl transferase (holo-ACP synthase)